MAIIKTGRMALEDIRKLLEAGIKLRIIAEESGYPESALSIMARAWGLAPRKRGPKPGVKSR